MQSTDNQAQMVQVITRDPSRKADVERRGKAQQPIDPTQATNWGLDRILALPTSGSSWAGFVTRGTSGVLAIAQFLEITAFRYQVAGGVGLLFYFAVMAGLWKFNPRLRGNLIVRISPIIVFVGLVLGGNLIELEKNNPQFLENLPTQNQVEEGVG